MIKTFYDTGPCINERILTCLNCSSKLQFCWLPPKFCWTGLLLWDDGVFGWLGGLCCKGDIPNGPMCWESEVGGMRPPGFLRLAAAADRNDCGEDRRSLCRWNASRVGSGGRLARKALWSLISRSGSFMSSLSFRRSRVSYKKIENIFFRWNLYSQRQ